MRSAARQPGAKEKEALATGIPPQQSKSHFEPGRAAAQNIAARTATPARVLRLTGGPAGETLPIDKCSICPANVLSEALWR